MQENCKFLAKVEDKETEILITKNSVEWFTSKKIYSVPFSLVVGTRISNKHPCTIKLMFFDLEGKKFSLQRFFLPEFRKLSQEVYSRTCECPERNICVVLNPISGEAKGARLYQEVLHPVLKYSPIPFKTFETNSGDFIADMCRYIDLSRFTEFVCVGGDGTVHQLLTCLQYFQPELLDNIKVGIFPAGSRNSLAVELGCKLPCLAALYIVKNYNFPGDLIKVELDSRKLLATTSVNWGIVTSIVEESQEFRAFGAFRYNLLGIKRFFQRWKLYRGAVKYKVNDQKFVVEDNFLMCLVGNHRLPDSRSSEVISPSERINNGKLGLTLLVNMGRYKAVKYFLERAQGKEQSNDQNTYYEKVDKVTIVPKKEFAYNIDGEIYYSSKLKVEVWPKAIKYIGHPLY
mmetsp:Transcript_4408/g.6641  ORF Transcript_4408/g.6641 Transcript_4408/m.6641 type:complete len:402 (-) Transcript_4408:653-1858(-)